MVEVGSLLGLIPWVVFGFILSTLIKFLHNIWWVPTRIKYVMQSQGINGPPFIFIYGNAKEISEMERTSLSTPMALSHDIYPRLQPHFRAWSGIYGRNFLFWHGSKPQMLVMDSEFVKEILSDRDKAYPKTKFEGFVGKLFGDGLVSSEKEKWAKLRKIANHAFRAENLKGMIPTMITSVETMLEKWKNHEGEEIEVYEQFKILTSDVISRTAFGSSYLEGHNIFQMLVKLTILASKNYHTVSIPGLRQIYKTKDEIESEKLADGIKNSILEIIKKREKAMTGESGSFGTDYLGLLMNANHDWDEGYRVTVEDVITDCKTFYFAGQETTNSLLAWTVLLLAIHTDWQHKAREEVLQVFGQQHPNSEGIGKLKAMNMIINETLRLYPPAPLLARKAERDIRLGKLVLPKQLHLLIPILALHHDPEIWGEDVHQFKPERFSEGVAKATNHNPPAFIPFGLGPRICVGMNFATNEAKIALSMILQRYMFTLSPTYIHSPVQVLTVCPQHGLQGTLTSWVCKNHKCGSRVLSWHMSNAVLQRRDVRYRHRLADSRSDIWALPQRPLFLIEEVN